MFRFKEHSYTSQSERRCDRIMDENRKLKGQLEKYVIQDWLIENCSWKQQTVVLCALRGCDGLIKGNPTKVLSRSLRNVVLKNADRSTTFIYNEEITEEQIKNFIDYLDSLPVHYVTHFAHGVEIVGYFHPNEKVRQIWENIYLIICSNFHMNPESKEENKLRLQDNIKGD